MHIELFVLPVSNWWTWFISIQFINCKSETGLIAIVLWWNMCVIMLSTENLTISILYDLFLWFPSLSVIFCLFVWPVIVLPDYTEISHMFVHSDCFFLLIIISSPLQFN